MFLSRMTKGWMLQMLKSLAEKARTLVDNPCSKECPMANKNRLKQGENGVSDTTTTTPTTTKTAQTRFNRNEVPTLEQCQQEVREYAYELWEAAGCPEGDGSEFWIEAETQLYGGMTPQGGYRVYVGEDIDKNPSPQAFILTLNGLEEEETLDSAPATKADKKGKKETAAAAT